MKFTFLVAVTASSMLLVGVTGLEEPIVIPQSELQALLPQTPLFDYTLSEAFTVGSDDEFITPAEASNFTETATYEEVTDFFTRLSAQSEFVQVESLVELASGGDVWMVTISGEQQFSADTMTKPVFFVTAGIHSGESLGVNAGMMFARNLVMDPEYADLLNSVNFVIIPVLNVQGYVRQSEREELTSLDQTRADVVSMAIG
jgi:murein tripeptide amidase MpaA